MLLIVHTMLSLIFSILILALGLFTIYLRVFKNNKGLSKIEKMKQVYGERFGTYLHIISYTVIPIVLGIAGIVCFFLGIEIF